jgi:hypothetical protein
VKVKVKAEVKRTGDTGNDPEPPGVHDVKAMPAADARGGMLEWSAAVVEQGGGKPAPNEWDDADLPGRPSVFAGANHVAYRTAFADPRDPDEGMACLELRGLYDGGDVWLNDDRVAETDTVFEPVRVPFEPAAENELVVVCHAPDDRYGGIHDTDRIPEADSVPGVWWDCAVTTHPETFVVDVDLMAETTGPDEATIEASIAVFSRDGIDDRLTLTTRPAGERRGRGMMDRVSVTVPPGELRTVSRTIELRDPSLWWPRGVGDQHRYTVRAKFDDDVTSATTGLVTVTETADGLAVNGEQFPIRGVTVQDGTIADVERAVEVNANLVRAHAHLLSPTVYEACDAAGLLVWQDLPLTGPGGFDVERGRAIAQRVAETYARHPSLSAFAVHDEPTALFDDRVGSGFLDRLRFRWRVWRSDYDPTAAGTVAGAFPDDRPVYPVVGEPGTDPDAAALYPGWDYGSADDLAWVRDRFDLGGIVGEFGAGALADDDDPDDLFGFDRVKHDALVDGDHEASQSYQAEVVRSVAEQFRIDGTGVTVANALRDTGDAGMGVYGRDGDPKTAADALATAFEPIVALAADPTPGETDLVVVNDTPRNITAELVWAAGDAGDRLDATVGKAGRAVVDTVELPESAELVTLELTVADATVQSKYRL